jgi:hypothetical protein
MNMPSADPVGGQANPNPVVAFPGGRGMADIVVERARNAGIKVIEIAAQPLSPSMDARGLPQSRGGTRTGLLSGLVREGATPVVIPRPLGMTTVARGAGDPGPVLVGARVVPGGRPDPPNTHRRLPAVVTVGAVAAGLEGGTKINAQASRSGPARRFFDAGRICQLSQTP